MKPLFALLIIALPALSGCGANSLAGATSTALPLANVPIRDAATMPAGAKALGQVTATSCKNKAWDPDPSEANALNLLKLEAAKLSADGVAEVTYQRGIVNPLLNCWSSITATGTAFSR